MWALTNRTRYAAERNWTRNTEGVHEWLVAVRATLDIAPDGSLRLTEKQLPPVLAPEYFEEPGKSSLRYESDLLGAKPGTEIVVVANAHAPGGRAATTVPVSLRAGRLSKELLVHGERVYYQGAVGLTVTAPRPFTTRAIRYEVAFGGVDLSDRDPRKHRIDERNPIGRGFTMSAGRLVETPAHAVEYARGNPATVGPAGFGAIDPSWMPRRALAGTYDAQWENTKKPLLPDDYNPAFAMGAPHDQIVTEPLVAGERVELRNMTPDGLLWFAVPAVSLKLTSRFGSRRVEHAARLTTVLVEAEERRASLVWQSALRVAPADVEYLDETVIVESGVGG